MIRLAFIFLLSVSVTGWASDHQEAGEPQKKSEVPVAKFVDLPAHCFPKKFPCALHFTTGGQATIFGIEIRASKGTSLLMRENEMEILSGEIWSEQFEGTTVRHGIIEAALTGDVLLEKDDDELKLTNLNGVVEIKGGRKTAEPIPSGFQNWYRGLGQKGEFVQGVLEPINYEDFLPTWVSLTGLPHKEAQEKISTYVANRKQAIEESAQLYRDILQLRRLAAEEQDRLAAIERRKRQKERQHFRQMMHDRLFRPD